MQPKLIQYSANPLFTGHKWAAKRKIQVQEIIIYQTSLITMQSLFEVWMIYTFLEYVLHLIWLRKSYIHWNEVKLMNSLKLKMNRKWKNIVKLTGTVWSGGKYGGLHNHKIAISRTSMKVEAHWSVIKRQKLIP